MNDKRLSIILTIICAVLMAIATAYAVLTAAESVPEGVPPEVNTEGLCVHEPVYKMYYTDADVVAVAKMLYGESRGCSIDNQQKAVWCVLNRVDADGFPDTIIGVLSQPNQFHGYSTAFPVWDDLTAVAEDVLTRWSLEKQGVAVNRALPKSYLYFTGTGRENIFREAYCWLRTHTQSGWMQHERQESTLSGDTHDSRCWTS